MVEAEGASPTCESEEGVIVVDCGPTKPLMPGRISIIATTGREQGDQTHGLSEPDIQECPSSGRDLRHYLRSLTIIDDCFTPSLIWVLTPSVRIKAGTFANFFNCIHSMIKTQHSGRILERRHIQRWTML